jgi:acyl-coenzyme A thioesterase PaaI-like protein
VSSQPAEPGPAADRGGAAYAHLQAQARLLLDRIAGATPPSAVLARLAAELAQASETLLAYQAPPPQRWNGRRPDLPGRGHLILPPYVIDAETPVRLAGRVTFSQVHLGSNGAVHGGVHTLLFDELLGRLVNHGQAGTVRTACLHVNYRKIAPVDVELGFEVEAGPVEGRKRFVSGCLTDPAGDLIADSKALFVALREGGQ